MAPVGPWAQPKATRREGGRRAERPAGSYATPDTPCSRTAPKGLPQTEAWAERERVPSGHNCRRQLATDRPEQIQGPGTAVPGTPIFANYAQRGGPPLESPCRVLSLVLSFASKESTTPSGRQPHRSRRSRRVKPLAGAPLRQSWLFPSLTVGFPRGKQSARAALPCAPIAICLHPSGSFPKRNELPSKRPALPSHEGGSSPFSHQNRAALLLRKRPLFIFVCQSFSASRSTFASAAATHSSTAALYASSCLVLSRDS